MSCQIRTQSLARGLLVVSFPAYRISAFDGTNVGTYCLMSGFLFVVACISTNPSSQSSTLTSVINRVSYSLESLYSFPCQVHRHSNCVQVTS